MPMLDPGLWPGEEMAHWSAFAQHATDYSALQATRRTILFRGQPQQWTLRPSVVRALAKGATEVEALTSETAALEHFRSQAHLHGAVPDRSTSATHLSVFEWWPLMQHYGAPTRLLDWTASPYVAAYYAAVESPDDEGVVLVIDADRVQGAFRSNVGTDTLRDPDFRAPAATALAYFTPGRKTTRLVAQQGYFTVATRPLAEHDELLAACSGILRRLIIPPRLKASLLFHLRTMNIGAHTLFAGLDGLGRSAGELIRTSTLDQAD